MAATAAGRFPRAAVRGNRLAHNSQTSRWRATPRSENDT
jgi:hypothetical protein